MNKICATCKYFEQGDNCSFCGNPKQTSNDLKKYTYYPFSCILHEDGIAESRIAYEDSLLKKSGLAKI